MYINYIFEIKTPKSSNPLGIKLPVFRVRTTFIGAPNIKVHYEIQQPLFVTQNYIHIYTYIHIYIYMYINNLNIFFFSFHIIKQNSAPYLSISIQTLISNICTEVV